MYTEVLDLVERDALVLAARRIRGRVVLRIRAESADVDFAGRDSAVGVNLEECQMWSQGTGMGQRTTTATNGSWYFWLVIWVFTSIPESQHP